MSVTKLNGLRLQRMIVAGANELHANKQAVDAMNVFCLMATQEPICL